MSLIDTPPPDEAASRRSQGRVGVRRRINSGPARIIDFIMTIVITCGGWGVVAAFALMMVFLTVTTYPLFAPPTIKSAGAVQIPVQPEIASTQSARAPANSILVDEYLANLMEIRADGRWARYHLASGKLLAHDSFPVSDGQSISSVRYHAGNLIIGYSDGAIRTGRVALDITYVDLNDASPELQKLAPGEFLVIGDVVAQRTVGDQFRMLKLTPELGEPIKLKDVPDSPVLLADFHGGERASQILSYRADGKLFCTENAKRGVRWRASGVEIPLPDSVKSLKPLAVLVGAGGRLGFVVYPSGQTLRYDLRDAASPVLVEEVNILGTSGSQPLPSGTLLTKVDLLLGGLTLVVGDSAGNVTGWFPALTPGATTSDGEKFVRAHEFTPMPAAVTAMNISTRDRQFVTADAQGNIYLRHMTSDTTDAKVSTQLTGVSAESVLCVALSPKNDEILALDRKGVLSKFTLSNPHPEGSLRQMFMPIHYEGYSKPEHVWQSSAGTDDAEMKIGLWPLIFGTLKATFYAMLFGVPVAIFAAIYSSEFMDPRIRAFVKPLIELMASLPSVVLGFVGALVFAPLVQGSVAGVVLLVYTVPLALLLAGYLWQLLPYRQRTSTPHWLKFILITAVVIAGASLTFLLYHLAENVFFAGNFVTWLRGTSQPASGWLLILSPLTLMGLTYIYNRYVRERVPFLRGHTPDFSIAAFELVRFVSVLALAVGLAWGIGFLVASFGWDIRSPGFRSEGAYMDFSPIGPYVQRNTLLVGLFMGFAIIPIIYTVSEDALSRVPNALRSASLGLGATRWQTTTNIVMPVATSGIFAACMIGFGRAVGETMIVLMMSGRTPLLDLNVFNGLSALSANIATELPEAPINSTHYRVLFFSALILFAITFVVNTAAEAIRVRFRKRAANM